MGLDWFSDFRKGTGSVAHAGHSRFLLDLTFVIFFQSDVKF